MLECEIADVHARRVWDSRGNPTVEVEVRTSGGAIGRAIAPAGASRGTREAIDKRDGGDVVAGMDVQGAIGNVIDRIAPAITGQDVTDQAAVDSTIVALDPSPLKHGLGGNATVATSLAVLHAGAAAKSVPLWRHCADLAGATPRLPLPEIQIFGGGAHAGRRVDIQDFMIMVPGAESFEEVMQITSEIYRAAGSLMEKKGALAGVADEGGWWPQFDSNEDGLATLVKAIELAGEVPGDRVVISLDIAASEFCSDGRYRLALEDRELGRDEMIDLLGRWLKDYPIVSIEDPLAEDDPEGMRAFTQEYGGRVQIIGDDYLVTNTSLLDRAIADQSCNAVLIKVNQVGTVSESLDCLQTARDAGFGAIVSARSGETEDVSISHMATGFGMGQLKVGSFTRSERMAKWNECLRIGETLGRSSFAGAEPLSGTAWARTRKGAA
ncbi:MAG: phosphopyruvate hydratase [Arenibacterium sp.]